MIIQSQPGDTLPANITQRDDEYEAPKVCVHPLATRPVLYTDTVGGNQTCRDDLWAVTTDELNALHWQAAATDQPSAGQVDERALFEAYLGPKSGCEWRNLDGSYQVLDVQRAWEIWQVGASLTPKPPTLDEALHLLEKAEYRIRANDHRLDDVHALLDRARKAGML